MKTLPSLRRAALVAGSYRGEGSLFQMKTGRKPIHGHSTHSTHSITYESWLGMRRRCRREWDDSYRYYGGRGITVCERWSTFSNFLEDMGNRPSKDHSIDRIDSNGNYEPENCRWATRREQGNNRRNNRILEFRGESKTLSEWALQIGISANGLRMRLSRWTLEKSLTEPLHSNQTHTKK